MNTSIESPVPGKVLKVFVKNGEAVNEDTVVLLIESMKMEIDIYSPTAGTIREVRVKEGQVVEPNDVMVIVD
jgi:biotin carboxyl carrier protein